MDSQSLSHTRWCIEINKYIIQIQRSRNNRRSSVCRPCIHMRKYSVKAKCFKFYGIPKGEEYANDI